jgi:MHS family proline/betaine transporter-like MFS transporter
MGALLFGQLGDRVGQKRALMVSALLMAAANLIEGLLPTYATIGFLAPAVFVCARIISGISLGGEYTGTFVMLFESAPTGRRGLTTSLANVMGGTGVFLASSLVALLIASLSQESMESWDWRIPFFTGFIALIALAIRTKVSETPLFEELRRKGETLRSPLRESVRRQPRAILITFATAAFNALSYYLVIAFVPTYLVSFVKVDHATAMLVATVAGAFNVLFIAIPGWISDFFRTQAGSTCRMLRISFPWLSSVCFVGEWNSRLDAHCRAGIRNALRLFHGTCHDRRHGKFSHRGAVQRICAWL